MAGGGGFWAGVKYQQKKQTAFTGQFRNRQGIGTGLPAQAGNRTGLHPVKGQKRIWREEEKWRYSGRKTRTAVLLPKTCNSTRFFVYPQENLPNREPRLAMKFKISAIILIFAAIASGWWWKTKDEPQSGAPPYGEEESDAPEMDRFAL